MAEEIVPSPPEVGQVRCSVLSTVKLELYALTRIGIYGSETPDAGNAHQRFDLSSSSYEAPRQGL